MEQPLTFDKLPEAVATLIKEVSELKRLLMEQKEQPVKQPDKLLNVHKAAEFLNLKVGTMYSKARKGELPVMKRSKRLYFSRTELLNYLKDGRNDFYRN